jgi:hypothetical protein
MAGKRTLFHDSLQHVRVSQVQLAQQQMGLSINTPMPQFDAHHDASDLLEISLDEVLDAKKKIVPTTASVNDILVQRKIEAEN